MYWYYPLGKNFNKYNYFIRVVDEIRLGFLQVKLIKRTMPFIVQSANNPLLSQFLLAIYCRFKKILFINWITDLLGVGIKKGSYYLCRERQIQREHVVSYLIIFTTLISLTVQSWYPTFNIFRSCFCPFVYSSVDRN